MAILLTGATSGLGRWLAPRLADTGEAVLVHGRDPSKVEATVAELGGRAEGFVADLASLAQVHSLAEEIARRGDLRILVNNAGIGFGGPGSERELSADGFELRWAVNYLAPVALARALLPSLRANRPARIVNVGSLGQAPIDFDDLRMDRDYDGTLAYRRSKLALAAWSFELAEQLQDDGIAVNCLHPATFMATAMVTGAGVTPISTVDEGGAATLRLIVDDVGSGGFFDGQRPARANRDAYDPAVRAKLRQVTDTVLD
jgi:NAD(P)-dependent dehydrogenase (short-subunit alcohol dehydrogenase family)